MDFRTLFSRSLPAKLYLLFFLIGVLPLLGGSYYAYLHARNALQDQVLEEQADQVQSGILNMVIFQAEARSNLLLMAENAAFVRYFEEPAEREIYREIQEKAFRQLLFTYPDLMVSAGYMTPHGEPIVSVASPGALESSRKPESLFAERKTIVPSLKVRSQAIPPESGEIYWGLPVFSPSASKWVIPAATPIRAQYGRILGIIHAELNMERLFQFLKKTIDPNETAFMVDREGRFIVHTGSAEEIPFSPAFGPEDSATYQQAVQRMIDGKSGSMRIEYEGKPHFVTYRPIPAGGSEGAQWSLAVLTPENKIDDAVSPRKYLFLAAGGSGILLLMAGILGKWIATPIRQLEAASLELRQGNLSRRVSIPQTDEIGQLASAFNAMADSIQASYEEALKLSTTDGLTGLYNHREFQRRLEEEVQRAVRHGHTLSLLMMDLDHFKRFNDTHGHPAGDAALQMIGKILLQEIRLFDVAARYGGEEISVILPETDPIDARLLAERVRERIRSARLPVPGAYAAITVSIGIASIPEDAGDGEALTSAADQALYFAKNEGRDRVVAYGSTEATRAWTPEEARDLLARVDEWLFKDVATAIESRQRYARGHAETVTETAYRLGETLGMSGAEIQDLRIATLIHDVGNLHVPSQILNKQGPLTSEEWEVVKSHPEKGESLVRSALKLQRLAPAILHHHENYDGSGYPHGLQGEEIPLLARIIRVVDAYHAMTSVTPYRLRKMTHEEAIEELRKSSGYQFDPQIVSFFIVSEHRD